MFFIWLNKGLQRGSDFPRSYSRRMNGWARLCTQAGCVQSPLSYPWNQLHQREFFWLQVKECQSAGGLKNKGSFPSNIKKSEKGSSRISSEAQTCQDCLLAPLFVPCFPSWLQNGRHILSALTHLSFYLHKYIFKGSFKLGRMGRDC